MLSFGWPGSRLVVTQVGARVGGCRASFCPVCCDVEGSSLARPQSAECACRKAGPLGGCRAGYCPRQATEQGELAAVVQCRDSGPESHTRRAALHTPSRHAFSCLLSVAFSFVIFVCQMLVSQLSSCQPASLSVCLSVRSRINVVSFFCWLSFLGASWRFHSRLVQSWLLLTVVT